MAEKTVGEKEQNLSDLEILKDKENLGKNTGRNVDWKINIQSMFNQNLIKDLRISVKPCKIL